MKPRCCGKILYTNKNDADEAVVRTLRSNKFISRFLILEPYECQLGYGFHIGNRCRRPEDPMQILGAA